jgi:hypothetical protein
MFSAFIWDNSSRKSPLVEANSIAIVHNGRRVKRARGLKLHVAALALAGWVLMVPTGIRAQSQLVPTPPVAAAVPARSSAAPDVNNTLEIPVVVQTDQPPLDPTFVGSWCGYEHFEVYESEPPDYPEPPIHGRGRQGATFSRAATRA